MADYLKIQSEHQQIRVAMDQSFPDDHILYLDNTWQYASVIEYQYHESIATMPACVCDGMAKVLICGGGDGLAARELLRFNDVEIDLVEIDKEMLRIYQNEEMLTKLNSNSLNDPRCNVICDDAIKFVDGCSQGKYDMIILDFPSPANENSGKKYLNLFSPNVTNKILVALRDGGVLVSQTSIQTENLVSYIRNLCDKGFHSWNYDAFYIRRGAHDNFTVSSRCRIGPTYRPIPKACRYITDEHVRCAFSDVTLVTEEEFEYYRLFEYQEEVEFELPN